MEPKTVCKEVSALFEAARLLAVAALVVARCGNLHMMSLLLHQSDARLAL